MTDLQQRLGDALRDRYALERELGGERIAYADTVGVVVQDLRGHSVDAIALPRSGDLPGSGGWAWSDDEVEVTRATRGPAWPTWSSIVPFWDHGQDAIHFWEDGAVWRVRVVEGPRGPRLIERTRVTTLDGDDRLFGVHPDADLAREIRALEEGGR